MNLVFVTEARFFKDDQGNIYGDAAFEHHIWERYLNIFNKIFVIARVNQKSENLEKKYISSGKDIHFLEMTYYVGPLQYLQNYFTIRSEVKNFVKANLDSAFICRIPGNVSDMVIKELRRNHKNYGVEIVGDPDDVFSDESFKHPLKRIFHTKTVQNLKQNIYSAKSTLYVTKNTLQKKYPSNTSSFTTYASNVMLPPNLKDRAPKKLHPKKNYKVMSAGSVEQMYKAPDIALEAVRIYNEKFPNLPIEFTWLGDGIYLENLRLKSKEMNLVNFQFRGQVSSVEVNNEMSSSDLFILVSRTEGLPRVIVEAMSEGLPVIGTNVGGIPELLSKEALIEKNNPEELALKIYEILSNAEIYNRLAQRNLVEAGEFDTDVLRSRREEFYKSLKNDN